MSRLRAAAGAIDLQPIVGAPLSGFAARLEPSLGVHDPLLARLLLIDDGQSRLLWISCELIGLDPEDDAQLRRRLASHLSTPAECVLISCTHTHSGPGSMHFRGPLASVDEHWLSHTFARIIDEAACLPERLRPAELAHATATLTGFGYNRQDQTSPIDQLLITAQLVDQQRQPIATILNYATHPVVLGRRNLHFTGDWPGYAMRYIEQTAGGVALFVLGSAGDVDPVIYRDAGPDAGTFEIARRMGEELASTALRALEHARPQADAPMASAHASVHLPLEGPPSRQQIHAMKNELLGQRGSAGVIPQTLEARWALFQLEWIEQLERVVERGSAARSLAVQLIAARVGDVSIITFPLEVYSQIGLDVRERLAPRPVIIAACTNGLFGYAPTDRAIEQGGYGPALSHRFFPHLLTPLARGTHATLVQSATTLLGSMERSPSAG